MPQVEPSRRFVDAIDIGVLTRVFRRDLIDEIVAGNAQPGKQARTRLLPARVVMYFVLAICLFADEAYEEVVRRIVSGLRYLDGWTDRWHVPTSGAMSQARDRLGVQPMIDLFDRVVVPIARPGTVGAWFGGLRVMAIDGAVIDLQDTPENLEAFGKFGSGDSRSPCPQLRLIGLSECGTHVIVDAVFDAVAVDERVLIRRVFPTLTQGMLVMCDRGFYSYDLWCEARATGAELLWRIKDDLKIPVLGELPDGSYLSELVPRQMKSDFRRGARKTIPDEVRIPVRIIEYTIPNRGGDTERIRVMTSLLDHREAPGRELAALYHERWEIELAFKEVKAQLLPKSKRLRSRTPKLVEQEMWAMLLTHYAVRSFMQEAVDDSGEDVDRASFIRSVRVIRRLAESQAAFPPLTIETSDS